MKCLIFHYRILINHSKIIKKGILLHRDGIKTYHNEGQFDLMKRED